MHKYFFSLLSFFFILGCTPKVETLQEKRVVTLANMLHTLDENNTLQVSTQLAKDIFAQTHVLSKTFEFTSPPQFHNFLVNVGVKDKGLCYHWSDALYEHFNNAGDYGQHFEFHLMGANIGQYWSEHNVLVVSAKEKKVEEGVIIDPWRNPDVLYFSKVEDDTEYRWIHRSDRGCKSILKR